MDRLDSPPLERPARLFALAIGTVLAFDAPLRAASSALQWLESPYEGPVLDVERYQDDGLIVIAGAGPIQIRDGETAALLSAIPMPRDVLDVAVSAKGNLAWVHGRGGGGGVARPTRSEEGWTWDVTALRSETVVPGFPVALSEDRVFTGNQNGPSVEAWSAINGEHLFSLEHPEASAQSGGIDVHEAKGWIAFGGGTRGFHSNAAIWSLASGRFRDPIRTTSPFGLGHVAFSPSGDRLMTGASGFSRNGRWGRVEVWNAMNGVLAYALPIVSNEFDFSTDGRFVATLSGADVRAASPQELQIWRAASGDLLASINHLPFLGLRFARLCWASDGRRLFLAGNRYAPRADAGWERIGRAAAISTPVVMIRAETAQGQATIEWAGGLGPYRVEASSEIGGEWRTLGETADQRWTETVSSGSAFFRVRSLTP